MMLLEAWTSLSVAVLSLALNRTNRINQSTQEAGAAGNVAG